MGSDVLRAGIGRASHDASRKVVGKGPGGKGWSQESINQQLVMLAHRFDIVARLKGGDHFVFGRGGEEVLALFQAGIGVEVVPGISSAFAAPTLAAIPVTHRGKSASVIVVEGHDPERLEWEVLGNARATLVFLMAMGNSEIIQARLLASGKERDTPAAIIERASYPEQRVIKTSLHRLSETIRKEKLSNPAVIVVGQVVDVLPLPETLWLPGFH